MAALGVGGHTWQTEIILAASFRPHQQTAARPTISLIVVITARREMPARSVAWEYWTARLEQLHYLSYLLVTFPRFTGGLCSRDQPEN